MDNEQNSISPAAPSNATLARLKSWFVGDRWLWFVIVTLTVASVMAVLSSASVLSYQRYNMASGAIIAKHVLTLLVSLAATMLLSRIHPKFFSGMATMLVFTSFGLLLAVYLVGVKINGSARWISVGGFTFQPSEIAKISLVLYVAHKLAVNVNEPKKVFLRILAASAILCLPIMLENLSTCLLMITTLAFMLFIGRVPMRYLLSTAGLVAALFSVVILLAPYEPVKSVVPRAATWRARIERFVGGKAESIENASDNYQARQARNAVASAGLVGKGPGKSYIKNFLPMAYSDFVFSILIEEWGIFGLLTIIACFFVLMWRAIVIARRCDKPFHMYTILGLAFLICTQAIINMAVGVGLIPVTGQTLPLVSMGGSSNMIMGAAFGIMLSISVQSQKVKNGETADKQQLAPADDYYEEAEAIRF